MKLKLLVVGIALAAAAPLAMAEGFYGALDAYFAQRDQLFRSIVTAA